MGFQVKDKKKSSYKLLKYLGNVITILAIILIIKKLYFYDLDYAVLFLEGKIVFFIIILFVYMSVVFWGGIPWTNIVNVLTQCNVRYLEVVFIFVKSNILKYIPGNVFQYVGRNELALKKNIKHSKVALATLIDAAWNIVAVLFFSVILSGKEFTAWLRRQQMLTVNNAFIICGVAVVGVIIFLIICIWKKQVIIDFARSVRSVKLGRVLLFNLIFYGFIGIINAGLYVAAFSLISGNVYSLQEVMTYIGIMLVSLVAGFITPGAPGGVGVREASSLFLFKGRLDEDVILLGIVIMRVISIAGDLAVYFFVLFFSRLKSKYGKE